MNRSSSTALDARRAAQVDDVQPSAGDAALDAATDATQLLGGLVEGEQQGDAGEAGDQAGKGLGSKLKAGGVAAVVAAAAGIAVAFVAAYTDAMECEVETDRIAAALAAGPQRAAALAEVSAEMYVGAWGDSLAEVTASVGAVATTIDGLGRGATFADNLEAMTIRAMDFATIFDVDVARARPALTVWTGSTRPTSPAVARCGGSPTATRRRSGN